MTNAPVCCNQLFIHVLHSGSKIHSTMEFMEILAKLNVNDLIFLSVSRQQLQEGIPFEFISLNEINKQVQLQILLRNRSAAKVEISTK